MSMSDVFSNTVSGLLTKMTNEDNDIRFMAINDLLNELDKYPKVNLLRSTEKEMVKALLKSLTDKNSEVQNITAKCLGKVMKNISVEQQVNVANHLCSLLISDTEEHRDIAGISLKMIIAELPINSPISTSIIDQIVPKLLQQLNNEDGHMIQLDTLDILSELLNKFSYVLLNKPENLEKIQNTLKNLLNNSRLAIRKRANNALGSLASVMSNNMYNEIISFIINELNNTSDIDYLKTLISCIGTLCRSNSSFFEFHIDTIFPYLLKYAKNNDAELSETCIKSMETLALRCSVPITTKLNEIVGLSNELIKYDPNYVEENDVDSSNYMEESNEEEDNEFYDDMDSGDEFDDMSELEYSDDDDVSWKVRCASAKLIATLIQTKPESLPMYYNEIAPILISRLNEREDSVYVEVLNTIIILVKKTNTYNTFEASKNGMECQNNPKEQLYNLIDTICKTISRQIITKPITSRQIIYELLNEMLKAKCNLSDYLDSFINSIEQIFVTPQLIGNSRNLISSNLKLEALLFIKELFNSHSTDDLSKYYETIIGILEKAANDSFYKITCESFVILSKLITFLRPITYNEDTKNYVISNVDESYSHYFNSIYKIIMDHLSISDSDKEVKENCISCLGVLLNHVGDKIPADELNTTALPIILERLKNELTRIVTLKTLNKIINSPLLIIDNEQAKGINLTSIISDTITESTSLLHQSQRQYRVVSLRYLESVMNKYKEKLSYDLYHLIMSEIIHIFANIETDLHILPDSLNCLTSVIENCNRVYIENNESVKEIICNIIKLNSNVVDSGNGQESLLNCVRVISSADSAEENRKFYSQLIKGVSTEKINDDKLTKQSYSVLATCIAVICINMINDCPDLTENFVKNINDSSNDNVIYLSLLCLGEIGSKIDLYTYYNNVHINIYNIFSSGNDERKHAAAFALGNITLGNIKVYVPYLVECINNGNESKRFVLLALKETINKYIKSDDLKNGQEFPYIQEIWNLLFNLCEGAKENSVKSIIAECIGKFSLSSPSLLLPDLQNRINSTNNTIRSTVITAIRYTFTEQKNQKFDEILKTMIFDFLKLIGDTDLELRRISLSALNSAAYNKPDLICDCISDLLPLLYDQTNIDTSLIRTVEMGPFKHQVDDGLEIRKSAFDCMYTLLNNRPNYLDFFIFVKRVLAGLRDPNNEIRVLVQLIIQKLCIIVPNIVSQNLEDMVDPLKETLDKKTKKSDVKQEKDKHMELIRSTLKTIIKLNNLTDSANCNKFSLFYNNLKSNDFKYVDVFQQLVIEMENSDK
ncbi:TIP120-domain-containing protein [Piromyces finnis]|uniref:TIP120-domain-containing protein n=1 Tax=Piromyces finnis TaxID=1754191 RepID=A0A1Y1VLH1_9FUNG|nr:TIP120-domain-containing protein [Piromyces finnis]|eukprot:ORX59310.1 TIP120-domain-containing protein [Piromyces finnis]